MDEEQTISQLQSYSDQFEPSDASYKRVKNVVFSREYTTQRSTSISNFLDKITMRAVLPKLLMASLVSLCGIAFVAIPFISSPNTYRSDKFYEEASIQQVPVEFDNDQGGELDKEEYFGYDNKVAQYDNPSNFSIDENTDLVVGASPNNGTMRSPAPVLIEENEDTTTPQEERVQSKDAYFEIDVEEFDTVYTQLIDRSTQIGGYTVETTRMTNNDVQTGYILVRVPVDSFDEYTKLVRDVSYSITVETVQILDKQNDLTALTKHIDQISNTISELEALERPTDEDLQEIERLKVQHDNQIEKKDTLEQEVAFSTVEIHIQEVMPYEDPDTWSFENSWEEVSATMVFIGTFWIDFALWTLVPLVAILPVAIIIGFVIVAVRRKRT
jgi:hypothetical protein